MANLLDDLGYDGQYSEISNIQCSDNIIACLNNKKFVLSLSISECAEKQFSKLDQYIFN
jgi:hypothetical protein